MKNSTKIIIVIIIILCLGFIIIPRIDFGNEEAPPMENSNSSSQAFTVEAVVARPDALNNDLNVTGSLVANESVTLRSEVAGVVEKIYFKEGMEVSNNQLLVQLNDDELAAELEILNFTNKLNKDIEYRQKQLLKREAISKEEYETALTTLNTSLAEIKVKEVQIRQHKIRAPFSGTIGLRNISKGSYLNPDDAVATLYSIDPIKIDFSIPGRYTSELNVGDKISFTVDAYQQKFEGEIYAIEPQIDPETRSIRIRAISSNDEKKLLPGQFAKIELTISTFEDAIMIPTEAVIPELNGKKVFVLHAGKVSTKNITTGIRTADKVQVTEGLANGDTVITTGILQLQPGMEVDINIRDENE